jgi:hypothetical protein
MRSGVPGSIHPVQLRTNLYNAKPTSLIDAHGQLDRAV